MQVILLKSVAGVGQRDEIREVADGYAQNALIPQGAAMQATPERVAALQKTLAERTASASQHASRLASTLSALNGKRVVIKAKANERGHLFKGINAKDLAHEISVQLGVTVEAAMIASFDNPQKEVGERRIRIEAAGTVSELTLAVEAA